MTTLIGFSYAFGISTPYLENDTLKVDAGKNYTYTLTIQNVDDKNYYVDVTYSSTDNIADLRTATNYILNKTYNNTFNFDLHIPEDAKIGDRYILDYGVKPRTNESGTVTLGLELKRNIKILVINEKEVATPVISKQIEIKNKADEHILRTVGTIILAIVILVLAAIIATRIWKLSKGLSLKLNNERLTNYTISQAMNLDEVKTLLKKMSDEEFELPEIKNIYKEKISELTTHNLTHEIKTMSRRDVIKVIDTIK